MKVSCIFFVFLFLFISQWQAKSQTVIEKEFYGKSKYKNGYGIVLCSISRLRIKPYYTSYELSLSNYQTGKRTSLHKNTIKQTEAPVYNYENDSLQVYLTAEILPVGKYKIFNFHLDNGAEDFYCRQDFEIPFEVTENKISYIGDYLCVPIKASFLGIKGPYGGLFFLSDKLSRDSSIIANKYKEFDFRNIINRTPDSLINNIGCIEKKEQSF